MSDRNDIKKGMIAQSHAMKKGYPKSHEEPKMYRFDVRVIVSVDAKTEEDAIADVACLMQNYLEEIDPYIESCERGHEV